MRRYLILFLVAFALLPVLLVACDSPTAPSSLFPNFELIEDPSTCTLSAADRTVGGREPYQLRWTATGQPETSDPSPSWQYLIGRVHEITVRLHVTDDAGATSTAEKETVLDCS